MRFLRRPVRAQARQSSGATQVELRLLEATYRSASTLPSLGDAGFRVYSQNDEDGILHLIFTVLGADGIAVEIGCGNGRENNTTNLIVNCGWHALLIDADGANVDEARSFFGANRDTRAFPPVTRNMTITSDNVNAALAGFEGEIDLLSLDIDSIDYWVLRELSVVSPRVMVVETPTIWGPNYARTVPNDPRWTHAANPDFYGASLGAFDKLLRARLQICGNFQVWYELLLPSRRRG